MTPIEQLMADRLAELRKSASEMTDDELYEAVGMSRNNRRTPKEKTPRTVKAKVKEKAPTTTKKETDLEAYLNSLTPEQAAALLNQLGK